MSITMDMDFCWSYSRFNAAYDLCVDRFGPGRLMVIPTVCRLAKCVDFFVEFGEQYKLGCPSANAHYRSGDTGWYEPNFCDEYWVTPPPTSKNPAPAPATPVISVPNITTEPVAELAANAGKRIFEFATTVVVSPRVPIARCDGYGPYPCHVGTGAYPLGTVLPSAPDESWSRRPRDSIQPCLSGIGCAAQLELPAKRRS